MLVNLLHAEDVLVADVFIYKL